MRIRFEGLGIMRTSGQILKGFKFVPLGLYPSVLESFTMTLVDDIGLYKLINAILGPYRGNFLGVRPQSTIYGVPCDRKPILRIAVFWGNGTRKLTIVCNVKITFTRIMTHMCLLHSRCLHVVLDYLLQLVSKCSQARCGFLLKKLMPQCPGATTLDWGLVGNKGIYSVQIV